MRYEIKEYLIIKIDSQSNKFTQAFDNMEKERIFTKDKLGENYYYEEINNFIKDSFICPNKCCATTFYVTCRYFTEDNKKEILLAKCVNCNTNFALYREVSLQ